MDEAADQLDLERARSCTSGRGDAPGPPYRGRWLHTDAAPDTGADVDAASVESADAAADESADAAADESADAAPDDRYADDSALAAPDDAADRAPDAAGLCPRNRAAPRYYGRTRYLERWHGSEHQHSLRC